MKMIKPQLDNTFCWFPFYHLALKDWDHDGSLNTPAPCCVSMNNKEDPMGWEKWKKDILDKPGNKWQNIFHHESFQKLRRDALNNVKNSACQTCWEQESRSGISDRLRSPDPLISEIDIDNPKMISYDLKIDDSCNLRCRMCTPHLSNKLRIDAKQFHERGIELPETYQASVNTQTRYLQENSHQEVLNTLNDKEWNFLLDNLSSCRELKIAGGEPFTSKIFNELLDYAIANNYAKDIQLTILTNATKFSNATINKVGKFKKLVAYFSIDGINKTYEYIRYPMPFKKLQSSVVNFLNNATNYDGIGHSFTVQVYNIHNVIDYVDYYMEFYSKYIDKLTHLSILFDLVHPENGPLSIKWLPNYILKPILDKIELKNIDYGPKVKIHLDNLKGYIQEALVVDEKLKLEKKGT